MIFNEFLGIDYVFERLENFDKIELWLPNNACITLASSWWDTIDGSYISKKSLPGSIGLCSNDYMSEDDIPLLFGSGITRSSGSKIYCDIDVFATCFLMLSRLEEVVIEERDRYDRFQVENSMAYKFGFLDRPIVDEYVEMLWNMMKCLDPILERRKLNYENVISCDVDYPFDLIRRSFWLTMRKGLGDIVKRNSLIELSRTLSNYFHNFLGISKRDEFRENISWMMEVNERQGNKVAFYFITDPNSPFDPYFDFESKDMKRLIEEISRRGHEIGIHPGYECYRNSLNFNKAVSVLNKRLLEVGVGQSRIGGRMHCLRFDVVETPRLWEEAGLSYDSSLGFAEKPGFRCGTCQEFSMFDLRQQRPLRLKQRPLITMECSIVEDKYEGLGYGDEAERDFCFSSI